MSCLDLETAQIHGQLEGKPPAKHMPSGKNKLHSQRRLHNKSIRLFHRGHTKQASDLEASGKMQTWIYSKGFRLAMGLLSRTRNWKSKCSLASHKETNITMYANYINKNEKEKNKSLIKRSFIIYLLGKIEFKAVVYFLLNKT